MSTQRAEAVLSSEECSLSTMQGALDSGREGGRRLDASLYTTSNIEDIKVRYM